jgi:hypothetical protein
MNRLDNNNSNNKSMFQVAYNLGAMKIFAVMMTHPIERYTINPLATTSQSIWHDRVKDMYKGISFSMANSMTKFLGVRAPAMSFCQQQELSAPLSAFIVSSCDMITGSGIIQRSRVYHITSSDISIMSNLQQMIPKTNSIAALHAVYKGSIFKLFLDTFSWTMFFYSDKMLKDKFNDKSTTSYIVGYLCVLAAAEFILCPIKNTLIAIQAKKPDLTSPINKPLKIIDTSLAQETKKTLKWIDTVLNKEARSAARNIYLSQGLKAFWRNYPAHLALASIRVGLASFTMTCVKPSNNKKGGELIR